MRSQKKNLSFTTVRVLENASGTRSGTESLPKVFLHDNCDQISFIEMRSGTHFTQQNVFLLFTVVVTKHIWPYFQSRFPETSSERVSSRRQRRFAIMEATEGSGLVILLLGERQDEKSLQKPTGHPPIQTAQNLKKV